MDSMLDRKFHILYGMLLSCPDYEYLVERLRDIYAEVEQLSLLVELTPDPPKREG